jgi:hypothetical protein
VYVGLVIRVGQTESETVVVPLELRVCVVSCPVTVSIPAVETVSVVVEPDNVRTCGYSE